MNKIFIPLLGVVLLLGQTSARALSVSFDLFRTGPSGYQIAVFLDATESDFDEFVDGYRLTSPHGAVQVMVSDVEPNGAEAAPFTTYTALIGEVIGEWTLESTVFGLQFETFTVRVQNIGLTSADLSEARLLHPLPNSTITETNPTFQFTGPTDGYIIGLTLSPATGSYPAGGTAVLPGTATTWQPPFSLLPGTNTIFINYLRDVTDLKLRLDPNADGGLNASLYVHSFVIAEFLVGTVGPRITGPVRDGNQLTWSFPTESGKSYVVEYKNDSVDITGWQTLQTISGNGSPKTFSVTPGVSPAARFLRIRLP